MGFRRFFAAADNGAMPVRRKNPGSRSRSGVLLG